MIPNDVEPMLGMIQMIAGFWISRTIQVAAKLGLADLVAEEPKTVAELAEATETHAPSLYRLLRALASVGVFMEQEDGRFASTPMAATLETAAPVSLRAFATSELGEVHYESWGKLLHSVKTGEIAFNHVFGEPVWEYFATHPENAKLFNQSMTDLTSVVEPAVVGAYDFKPFQRIVDIGGGHGSFISSILKNNPHLEGILYDAPQVIEGAQERVAARGLNGRCQLVAGDFFSSVPDGGDLYLMKHIIHDWDDEKCITILRNCRRAMNEQGRVIVVDQVVPQGNAPSLGKFTDLLMLVMVGGKERTEEEFRTLFNAAGLKLTRIIQTQSPMSIIEGAKQ